MNTITLPIEEYARLKAAAAANAWSRQAQQAAEAWDQLGHRINANDPIMWGLLQSAEVRAWLVEAYVAVVDRRQRTEDSNAISAMRHWKNIGPSFDTLQRRRARPGKFAAEYRAQRGGDYMGGPVDWASGRHELTSNVARPVSPRQGVAA